MLSSTPQCRTEVDLPSNLEWLVLRLVRIVQNRIQSALIFEDDADWDVMIKSQLVEVARGVLSFQVAHNTANSSPYGNEWDMLWLGHCGVMDADPKNPKYYVIHEDPTVPPLSHQTYRLRLPDMSPPELNGNFTRVVFNNGRGICGSAYALSLKGAEKLLYQYSLEPQAPPWDIALSRFCKHKLDDARCFATFPALFQSYRAAGNTAADSDRTDPVAKFRNKGYTENLVYPMKPNLESFVTAARTVRSQWPNDTMFPEIDPLSLQIPKGRAIELVDS